MRTCRDVSHDLAADAFRTAGLRRRMTIRMHLLMCDDCRRFARQLEQMGVVLRQMSAAGDPRLSDVNAEQRILARIQEIVQAERSGERRRLRCLG